MLKVNIDGTLCKVPEGTSILDAAKECGIWIPTLCHHEALTPYGGCRLCVVELIQEGQTRIAASCSTKAIDGLVVRTDTEKIHEIRCFLIKMLLAEAREGRHCRTGSSVPAPPSLQRRCLKQVPSSP